MNTQINLLPDSKQQRLRQRRVRQLSTSIALVILAIGIGIPIILLAIKGSQRLYLNRVQGQIDASTNTLTTTPDINTMLSIKDHLNSLPGLYAQRTFFTKLLAYLPYVTPREIKLSAITLGSSGAVSFAGSAKTYAQVDKFYDALARAHVAYSPNKVEQPTVPVPYFSSVDLPSASGTSGTNVSFTINASFNLTLISGGSGG